nr:MAG TPA: hypothetical protein [Crassvirales sp.]
MFYIYLKSSLVSKRMIQLGMDIICLNICI